MVFQVQIEPSQCSSGCMARYEPCSQQVTLSSPPRQTHLPLDVLMLCCRESVAVLVQGTASDNPRSPKTTLFLLGPLAWGGFAMGTRKF